MTVNGEIMRCPTVQAPMDHDRQLERYSISASAASRGPQKVEGGTGPARKWGLQSGTKKIFFVPPHLK